MFIDQLRSLVNAAVDAEPDAVKRALYTVLFEQPCDATRMANDPPELFVCVSSYHTAIDHVWRPEEWAKNGCKQWIPNPLSQEGGKYIRCGMQTDGGCLRHGKIV